MHLDPILKLTTLSEEVVLEAKEIDGPATDDFIDWLLVVNDQFLKYRDDVEKDAEFFGILNPAIVKIPPELAIWQKNKKVVKSPSQYTGATWLRQEQSGHGGTSLWAKRKKLK